MLVLNTTSPSLSPRAPNALPENTVPSSNASLAMFIDRFSPLANYNLLLNALSVSRDRWGRRDRLVPRAGGVVARAPFGSRPRRVHVFLPLRPGRRPSWPLFR